MTDTDDDWPDMDGMCDRWESLHDDFLDFHKIPESERPFSSPDLCAFALLDKKFPVERELDMVSAAEHDQIWLRIQRKEIIQLTDDEILYLTRCGVMYEEDNECLSMFV